MVITRTPLRISFFGGGTDYPLWFRENGGAILSTTIDKYSYITVRRIPPFFDFRLHVVWSQIEKTNRVEDILHPSVRETIKFAKMSGERLGIHYYGDIPARSGIGSSSSFTVGFLHALYALCGKQADKKRLAREAIHIEQDLIKENVGSQDQIAAAFGGFNKIEFSGAQKFTVIPVRIGKKRLQELEERLLLFFTGQTRTASEIVIEQLQNIHTKQNELTTMRTLVDEAESVLLSKGRTINDFGALLHESWQLKRSLSSKISNSAIDGYYDAARKAGATGGKILGAGGGGFLLLFAEPNIHARIKKALKELIFVPFHFENSGSSILYQMT